jgi:hypothetical protein
MATQGTLGKSNEEAQAAALALVTQARLLPFTMDR